MTPIVKASKGRQAIAFFTLKEYENWREEQGAAASGWQIKYYKGLGTSSAAEAKAYFSDLDLHELSFEWTGDADREGIVRAFSKSMADARKEWLRGCETSHRRATTSHRAAPAPQLRIWRADRPSLHPPGTMRTRMSTTPSRTSRTTTLSTAS